MPRLKVGVLISGRGSNLQALISAAADPTYPAEIVVVISNRADAQGLARAAAAGIPHQIVTEADRAAFAKGAEQILRAAKVELIALAGFMRILDDGFVQAWEDRMINIHPSLLPAFPGLHPQRQALAAGVKFSGCTVHFVRVAVDTGPIIAQAAVPVEDDDDEDRLAARILAAEHRLYPLAVRLYAEGRLRIEGNRVAIAGGSAPSADLFNPTETFGNLASADD
jgi:phosphoribosylglycinamide formyltransferase 1